MICAASLWRSLSFLDVWFRLILLCTLDEDCKVETLDGGRKYFVEVLMIFIFVSVPVCSTTSFTSP